MASWKNLLVKKADIAVDQLDGVTTRDALLTFLFDNDVFTTVSPTGVGGG